jgi:hypothetical protein
LHFLTFTVSHETEVAGLNETYFVCDSGTVCRMRKRIKYLCKAVVILEQHGTKIKCSFEGGGIMLMRGAGVFLHVLKAL